ncbi:MAG: radical SAM protein, partial [Acidimicrobiales bacterium]|nr:radical SAM protein [Acidimicrobiales bacterium]
LTGGEPLLRRDLTELVARIASIQAITDLALTTNGTHLAEHASRLRSAGLGRVTISLDTLRADRHHRLTRRDNHGTVLAGIDATLAAGFENTKINAVVMRGVNDDELVDLIRFGAEHRAEVRFIEYMDVGGATRWDPAVVVGAAEILERVGRELGHPEPAPSPPSAPARRFTTPDGHCFGIVASTSTPFCSSCDRSRLTADGLWYHCLYAAEGIDLGSVARRELPVDASVGVDPLVERIRSAWERRADQGAVDRLAMDNREPTPVRILRADPHREMHTRGG